jgi:drug/metabolite transporter (DMT)-like permease
MLLTRRVGGVAPAPMPRPAPPHWLAVGAVTCAAVIWSSSFAVTKLALAEIGPMTIGALRFAAAAVILGVVVHLRRGLTIPNPRQRLFIGAAGLLGITAYFAVENVGVDLATAADATLIVASYPLITLALELLLGRAELSARQLLGMLVAVAGVWLVVDSGVGSGETDHRLFGNVILLAGGVIWAAYNLVAQHERSGASPVVVTYYQTLAGAAGFGLLALTEIDSWSAPSTGAWVNVSFLAVFCSVAAFLLYNFGLSTLSASAAVNLLNIVPVAGLFWAFVLVGENIAPMQVLGGAVVVVGVSLGMARRTTSQARNNATESPGQR